MNWLVFHLLFLLPTDAVLVSKLERAEHLTTRVLLSEGVPDVSQMDRMEDHGLILFSVKDKNIHYYNFEKARLTLLARDGQGPGELHGGLIYGSVIGKEILVHEFATGHTKMFALGSDTQPATVTKLKWSFRSWIQFGTQKLIAVITTPGFVYVEDMQTLREATVPKDSLAFFIRNAANDLWELQGTFHDLDVMGVYQRDVYFNTKTNLFPITGTARFYRVPYLGSPELQVMNSSGQIVRELPIPHPFAKRNPKDPDLRLQRLDGRENLSLINSASVDQHGKLHILLDRVQDPKTDWSMRLIVVIDEFGDIESTYQVDRPVYRLTVSTDGARYYAIDYEEGQLLTLAPMPE